MPYIKSKQRPKFEDGIIDLIDNLLIADKNTHDDVSKITFDTGELNYVISSIVTRLLYKNKRYKTINDLIGVLECVKQELYRVHAAYYEDGACERNGPLLEC